MLWLIHTPLLLAKGIETTISSRCTHGENVAIPKDCHYYYYCAYGFFVRRECSPIGYVFSRSKGYCVPTYSPSNDCGLEMAKESAPTTKACISGLLYQNPANCGSYFLCYSGIFIQKYCFLNRVYSHSRQRCVDPGSAYNDCTPLTKINPVIFLSPATTTTTMKVTEALGTTTPSCTPGMLFPDSEDCRSYYNCTFSHTLVKKICSPGRIFSYSKKRCVIKGSTGDDCTLALGTTTPSCTPGMLFPDSEDCRYYYNCTFSRTLVKKICSPGRIFSYSKKRCVIKGSIGDDCTPAIGTTTPSCTPGMLFPDSEDCRYYYNCTFSHTLVKTKCSPGRIFSYSKKRCVTKGSIGDDCTPAIGTTTPSCTPGMLFPDSEDCRYYYNCTFSHTLVKTKCSPGRIFSYSKKRCVTKGSIGDDCTPAIGTMTPSCTPGMLFPDLEDCQSYYNCNFSHTLVKQICSPGRIFSYSKKRCVTKGSIGDDCTPAIGTMTPSCTPGMLFPDLEDCRSYYNCNFSHTLVKKICSPGQVFSYSKKRCVTKGSIGDDCTPAIQFTNPSCTPGVLFPDLEDCQLYYNCTFSHTLVKQICSPGRVFSYSKKRCVTKGSFGDDCTPDDSHN
ncbi:hypothetical protein ACJMK2_041592 [Sinanodonta woodiana]|uniref:Chitin-binding type-2 domain-containing protein n=1 Tax=Sinanodonta woodiana TaxID=1069815 RepID=A0ABD3W4N5_SINWO